MCRYWTLSVANIIAMATSWSRSVGEGDGRVDINWGTIGHEDGSFARFYGRYATKRTLFREKKADQARIRAANERVEQLETKIKEFETRFAALESKVAADKQSSGAPAKLFSGAPAKRSSGVPAKRSSGAPAKPYRAPGGWGGLD